MKTMQWVLEQEAKIHQEQLDFKLSRIKDDLFYNNLKTITNLYCAQSHLLVMSMFYSAIRETK